MQNSESVVVHGSLTLKIGYKCNQEDRRRKKTWLILHVESVCLVSTDDPKNNKHKKQLSVGKAAPGRRQVFAQPGEQSVYFRVAGVVAK